MVGLTPDQGIDLALQAAASVVGIWAGILLCKIVRAFYWHLKDRREWLFFEDSDGRLHRRKKIK